ncbi:hypothetical protein [Flavobacterium chungnamense]
MNLRTKKTIAKEILYFFIGIIIILIFWAFIEIQNSYYKNEVISYNQEIVRLHTLRKPLLNADKLKKLNENAKKMFESGSSKEDILAMKDAFIKRFGIKYNLNEKIKLEKLKKEEKVITNELNKTSLKILEGYEITDKVGILSIIFFVLLYPIRFVFILVRWAIKTIKIKD